MEKDIIMGVLGLIIGYFLFKVVNRKQKNPTDTYSDILTNDKYEVKDQWNR